MPIFADVGLIGVMKSFLQHFHERDGPRADWPSPIIPLEPPATAIDCSIIRLLDEQFPASAHRQRAVAVNFMF